MNLTATTKVRCPHCGRNLTVSVDISSPSESWIEECKFCNKSFQIASKIDDNKVDVTADVLN